ncbi:MAG: hypothetical protein AAFR73_04290 [Pseudomonadota bacterium]
MKKLSVLAFVLLPACENPSLGIGATISGNGVSVSPVVSGNVGGVGVAVSP